jgi:hypothetical protein
MAHTAVHTFEIHVPPLRGPLNPMWTGGCCCSLGASRGAESFHQRRPTSRVPSSRSKIARTPSILSPARHQPSTPVLYHQSNFVPFWIVPISPFSSLPWSTSILAASSSSQQSSHSLLVLCAQSWSCSYPLTQQNRPVPANSCPLPSGVILSRGFISNL